MRKQLSGFFKSFKYAVQGIIKTVEQERNFRFHIVVAVYVYVFSLFYNFGQAEYLTITILIGGMLALEMVNSAIERAVAKPDKAHDAYAGTAKDMAAGAVLIFAVASVVCGVILFFKKAVILNIAAYFMSHAWALIALIISLALSVVFIFRKEDNSVGE